MKNMSFTVLLSSASKNVKNKDVKIMSFTVASAVHPQEDI